MQHTVLTLWQSSTRPGLRRRRRLHCGDRVRSTDTHHLLEYLPLVIVKSQPYPTGYFAECVRQRATPECFVVDSQSEWPPRLFPSILLIVASGRTAYG